MRRLFLALLVAGWLLQPGVARAETAVAAAAAQSDTGEQLEVRTSTVLTRHTLRVRFTLSNPGSGVLSRVRVQKVRGSLRPLRVRSWPGEPGVLLPGQRVRVVGTHRLRPTDRERTWVRVRITAAAMTATGTRLRTRAVEQAPVSGVASTGLSTSANPVNPASSGRAGKPGISSSSGPGTAGPSSAPAVGTDLTSLGDAASGMASGVVGGVAHGATEAVSAARIDQVRTEVPLVVFAFIALGGLLLLSGISLTHWSRRQDY